METPRSPPPAPPPTPPVPASVDEYMSLEKPVEFEKYCITLEVRLVLCPSIALSQAVRARLLAEMDALRADDRKVDDRQLDERRSLPRQRRYSDFD